MRLTNVMRVAMVALAFTVVTGAKGKGKDSSEFFLPYEASLAGSHLAMGRYHVQWASHSPEATVTFEQGDKVVATVEGKVVDRGKIYSINSVVYVEKPDGTQEIKELRFKGSSKVIEFQ